MHASFEKRDAFLRFENMLKCCPGVNGNTKKLYSRASVCKVNWTNEIIFDVVGRMRYFFFAISGDEASRK